MYMEIQPQDRAKRQGLLYLGLYKEPLETGKTQTHDKAFLEEINQRKGHEQDVIEHLKNRMNRTGNIDRRIRNKRKCLYEAV